jgi:hypothetical protein
MQIEPIDEAVSLLDAEWTACQARKATLRAYLAEVGPEHVSALLEREPQLQETLDEACKMWADGRGLPKMDADVAYLVYARFQQALVFAQWIRGRARFPGKSVAQLLTLFLIDYWRGFGRAIWAVQVRDYAH